MNEFLESATNRDNIASTWGTLKSVEYSGAESEAQHSKQNEREQPQFELVPFAKIAKSLEDPRYEELAHATISAENAEAILREGLNVGGEGRDTDIDSNFKYLSNNNSEKLRNSAEDLGREHKNAKFVVLYRIPFQYKLPTTQPKSSETYRMFYEPNDDLDAPSGKYNQDFAYGYLDVTTGFVNKNNTYRGDLDDPEQKADMEAKYKLLRDEAANKISDSEAREVFLSMAESWHEMGEHMGRQEH